MAVANVYAALEAGVAVFDSSVVCPRLLRPRRLRQSGDRGSGHLLERLGIETGVDLRRWWPWAPGSEISAGRAIPGPAVLSRGEG